MVWIWKADRQAAGPSKSLMHDSMHDLWTHFLICCALLFAFAVNWGKAQKRFFRIFIFSLHHRHHHVIVFVVDVLFFLLFARLLKFKIYTIVLLTFINKFLCKHTTICQCWIFMERDREKNKTNYHLARIFIRDFHPLTRLRHETKCQCISQDGYNGIWWQVI